MKLVVYLDTPRRSVRRTPRRSVRRTPRRAAPARPAADFSVAELELERALHAA
jgi:hypothetical protein